MTTETMSAGQLAALDQAVAAYREACQLFASTVGTGQVVRDAEATLRRVGRDEATGLITLPVGAIHFTDIRADGARMHAVSGSLTGEIWVCWSGRSLRFGTECRTYDASDLIQVKG